MPPLIDHYDDVQAIIWRLVDHEVSPLVRVAAEFTKDYELGGEKYVFFNRLAVEPIGVRGQGYGTKIMTAAMPYFDEHGLTVVNPCNPYEPDKADLVVAFFRKFGFVPASETDITTLPEDVAKEPMFLVRKPQSSTAKPAAGQTAVAPVGPLIPRTPPPPPETPPAKV